MKTLGEIAQEILDLSDSINFVVLTDRNSDVVAFQVNPKNVSVGGLRAGYEQLKLYQAMLVSIMEKTGEMFHQKCHYARYDYTKVTMHYLLTENFIVGIGTNVQLKQEIIQRAFKVVEENQPVASFDKNGS